MKIVLAGAGGYAGLYVDQFLKDMKDIEWVGVCDPYVKSAASYDRIAEAGIPVYDTLEEFYKENTADLCCIAVPTYLHEPMSIYAVRHGSHVLVEKPAAPTAEKTENMIRAEKETGRFIAIGFQWSYSAAIRALKQDILDGVLGRPVELKTFISWPRNKAYFTRGTGWAGKISLNGELLLDSIASNACGHYVHNMLFVLGASMSEAAEAVSVEGDCLRANAIENFDTCTLRFRTADGTPLLMAASHAAGINRNPEFIYTFENAVVRFADDGDRMITAEFKDGTVKEYGDPFENSHEEKVHACMRAAEEGTTPICTAKTALPHVKAIEMVYHEIPIRDFPAEQIRLDPETDGLYVEGLYEKIVRAYEEGKLLSEL